MRPPQWYRYVKKENNRSRQATLFYFNRRNLTSNIYTGLFGGPEQSTATLFPFNQSNLTSNIYII